MLKLNTARLTLGMDEPGQYSPYWQGQIADLRARLRAVEAEIAARDKPMTDDEREAALLRAAAAGTRRTRAAEIDRLRAELLSATTTIRGAALELEWRDVDLQGARAIFWRTKGGRRRVAALPPAVWGAPAAAEQRSQHG